eukprot:7391092-Prymnesium_polylepis.2
MQPIRRHAQKHGGTEGPKTTKQKPLRPRGAARSTAGSRRLRPWQGEWRETDRERGHGTWRVRDVSTSRL